MDLSFFFNGEESPAHPAFAEGAIRASSKEASSPRTDCVDAEQTWSHVKKTHGVSPIPRPDNKVAPEARCKWVKRLLKKRYKPYFLPISGFKADDASSCEIQQKLDFYTHGCMKEWLGKTPSAPEGTKVSSIAPEEALQPWIRRWYHDRRQARLPTFAQMPVPCELGGSTSTENFDDKMFASIRAMALMGKAMNNLYAV